LLEHRPVGNELVALAVGVAVSPIPIAAMLLILAGGRATVNGPLFALGWTVGVAGSVTLIFVLVTAAGSADDQPTWLAVADVAVGSAFVILASRLLASPRRALSETPRWLTAVDSCGRTQAAALGVGLSAANPKNLALALGGAIALARTGVTGAAAVPALFAYVAIAAASVLLPLAAFEAFPAKSQRTLAQIRRFVIRHDRTMIVVLGLAIGAKLVLDGIRAL
jgi:Sap, sulfolipid-1-addressing protein